MFQKSYKKFKTLTLVFTISVCAQSAVANVLSVKDLKGYFRIFIQSQKNEVTVNHTDRGMVIRTTNKVLLDSIKKELPSLELNKKYIASTQVNEQLGGAGEVVIKFQDSDVVFFNFYRDRQRSNIIDIWSEGAVVDKPVITKAPLVKEEPTKKEIVKKVMPRPVEVKTAPIVAKKVEVPTKVTLFNHEKDYRDFRYGASFIWDYEPLAPRLKNVIELSRKTAEYFYPVVDRNYEKNDKEAHLQLIINLYRKKKWGLMYKAMKLFAKKYGDSTESDFLEYLKANALMKDNLLKDRDPKAMKNVISMYEALAEKTNDYELKKSLIKYLIQYHLTDGNYIATLSLAKRLYVSVQKNFDIEENPYAVDVILISLAKLRQIKKIENLVNDKTVVKIVPKARLASFKIYSLLVTGEIEKAIKYYREIAPSLPSAETASILFNMGEAYFRVANYEQAVKMFDKFVSNYSENERASAARLRIALSYDLLDRSPQIVTELYRNAINRSARDKISLEAKMRYVAYTKIRKIHPTEEDNRSELLLNFKEGQGLIDSNLKKILWSVRLRSFIVDQEYFKALSYLNAIPVSSLKPSERRMFNGDGAEIVLGIIQKSYEQGNFSKIIRLWEVYRTKYINKVALDPYINYIVGNSYIKLGLYDSFDTFYNSFKGKKSSPRRQFPMWVARQSHANTEGLIDELLVIKDIKLKNWDAAQKAISKLTENNRRKYYYTGLIDYNQKKYSQAVNDFENYFASNSDDKIQNSDDLGKMLDSYMRAIYHTGDMEKYTKVGSAIIKDLDRSTKISPYLLSVKEEISYMIIENIFSKKDYVSLAKSIKKFQGDYKNSIYKDRIKYLQAVSLVRTARESEGQKILQDIIKDKDVPNYLKELSKTELSLLKIKNKLI